MVSLRERVVEVEVDLGESAEPYRYGSGFRLGGRLVLTAAHVVTDRPAAEITVRGPDKVSHPAAVVDGLVGDPDTVDLALLELTDETAELPTTPAVVAVNRDAAVPVPVDGCWAVGYPLFQEVASSSAGSAAVMRETAQVWGMILPAENLVGGLLSLQVTSAPRDLPPQQEALGESQWSGMSGAAVFAGERLLGVISEHAPRRSPSTITVTPLTRVDRMPKVPAQQQWWTHLDANPAQLIKLPERRQREEPAYRRVLRQLRERTMLVGRDAELAEIRAFATGAATGLDPQRTGCAWLVGDAWAGKTALLAEAVHTLPPEVDWVAYFLSRTGGDADRERFVRAVVPQLAYLLDKAPVRSDEYTLAELWEQASEHAVRAGRQLLLVVDGLDEELRPGGYSVAGWLPTPGRDARVLVASRHQFKLSALVDFGHPLADAVATTVSVSLAAKQVRERAEREIADLLARGEKLGYELLGVLAAAAGPLTPADLVELTGASLPEVDIFVTADAARTLRPADAAASRYEFAHETLLATCQAHRVVGDRGYARRLHEWAAIWRDRGWPAAHDGMLDTPLYLLDTYPRTLYDDSPRLAALVGHVDWITAAVRTVGVDTVLAELRTAGVAAPSEPRVAAMHATVRGQAHHLRPPRPVPQPGYVLRQLCLQAAELTEDDLADDLRARLRDQPGLGLMPLWTTRRASRALAGELGRHDDVVVAVAVTPDGRVVSGGNDGRVLLWDPDRPQTPVELGPPRRRGGGGGGHPGRAGGQRRG